MASLSENEVLVPIVTNPTQYSQRLIGVEIETYRNADFESESGICVPFNDDPYGYDDEEEYEMSFSEQVNGTKNFFDPSGEVIALVGADGADVELTTQPMSMDALKNDKRVDIFFKNLATYGLADEESGTHIHVSKTEFDNPNLWRNLYWFECVYDKQIYNMFRRHSHWARSPKETTPNLGDYDSWRFDKIPQTPYCEAKGHIFTNFHKNTYECRAGAATTDKQEIIAWTTWFRNVINFCNRDSIIGHRFDETLVGVPSTYGFDRLTNEQVRQIVPLVVYKRQLSHRDVEQEY